MKPEMQFLLLVMAIIALLLVTAIILNLRNG